MFGRIMYENDHASIIASNAGVKGDFGWPIQGNWTLRDQCEPNLGLDQFLGSMCWDPITSELRSKMTLASGIRGNHAGSVSDSYVKIFLG